MEKNRIGARITYVRRRENLNQKEFSDELGIGQSIVSKIENGSRLPSIDVLSILNQKFNVDINWLITGEGEISSDAVSDEQFDRSNFTKDTYDFTSTLLNKRLNQITSELAELRGLVTQKG